MREVAALAQLLLVSLISASNSSPVAYTQQGAYIGQEIIIDGTNISYWYGIPYAQQPVGNLRWMPPQTLGTSNGTTTANLPNACPQTNSFGIPMTEACLSLNVYAPSNATNAAVFVWIHGGSFTSGAGVYYDGAPLVGTGVLNAVPIVVVTINYRLGLLGFLADNGLYAEKSGANNTGTTGNYGILDQIMALNWVKKNIAGFGGNPNKITVGGESAGGISMNILLTSPLVAAGTFQKAIVQSGGIWPDGINALEVAVNNTGDFLRAHVNCSTVQCLRNTTVPQILASQDILTSQSLFGASASPTIDGYVLSDTVHNYFIKGAFQKVPLLIGTTTNETSGFTCPYFNQSADIAQVQAFFVQFYGSTIAGAIPSVYASISSYANPLAYLNTVFSNSWVQCGSRRAASVFSSDGLPTYLYTYNHALPIVSPCLGVAHAAELVMLFPSILAGLYPNYNFSASEQQLSKNMMLSWASFIDVSDPNYSGVPATWVPYRSSSDGDFVFDFNPSMRYFYYNATCSGLWDRLVSVSDAMNATPSFFVALFVLMFRSLLA